MSNCIGRFKKLYWPYLIFQKKKKKKRKEKDKILQCQCGYQDVNAKISK